MEARMARTARQQLTPDPVPPAIMPGDTVYLIVPVTVRQLSRDGFSVINSVANLNKIATRAELRTARELGL
jgi:hypothetical protein